MLVIRLLGPPQVILDGSALKLARRKSRALLYYVAAHSQSLTREHLLALFWPDTGRPGAQQVLRTTLHGLRQALSADLLVAGETVSLAPGVEVDVRSFEAALAIEARLAPGGSAPAAGVEGLAAALDLYRGDFLAEMTLDDSPEFENWITGERERYRRLAVRGFIALARFHEERADYAAALRGLDRALALDPLQEDLQRAAMRLHYLAGDRPGAIRRFLHLRDLLDEEMGVPPMAETQRMYDAIVTDAPGLKGEVGSAPRRTGARALIPGSAGGPAAVTEGRMAPDGRVSGDGATPTLGPGSPAGPPPAATPAMAYVETALHGASSLPFAGRAAELETLRTLPATGKLALVEGEAGIGKSRLVEEFIRTSGVLALTGAGRELEQALPYQPVIEALRNLQGHPDWPGLYAGLRAHLSPVWLAEIARLLPELAATPSGPASSLRAADESRLWEGVNQFLRAVAGIVGSGPSRRPLLLFLDDLHWADASTLALLAYLVRQPSLAPIGFLATSRPVEPRSPLAALLQTLSRQGALSRLSLGLLGKEEVLAIARRLSQNYAYPLADWMLRTSEGNPYILTELVSHARQKGLLRPDGSLDLLTLSAEPVVPQSVYNLIQSRLDHLSGSARRVLEAAVAAGLEFEFDVAARAAGLSEDAAMDALDELLRAGVIRPSDTARYTFDHSLTAEVAYREMGEPRFRLLQRRVAEAIESLYRHRLDEVAGRLAMHFSAGHAPERAAPYAFRAGREAARLAAWREAIAFYEQALVGAGEKEQIAIQMALGAAQVKAGENPQASETFRRAVALAERRRDPAATDEARLALSQSFLPQSRYREAIEAARLVLTRGLPENGLRAQFAWGSALSLEGADLAEAHAHLSAAVDLSAADPVTLARAKFELGSVAAQQGDLRAAIALYGEALAAASLTEEAIDHRILAHNNLAYHLLLLDDPAAGEHAQAALALSEERGVLTYQPYIYSTLGEIALAAGDLEGAQQHFERGLALAERLSMPERIAGLTANLGLVSQRCGETALAIHRLSNALARADAAGTQHLAAQIRLWLVPLLPSGEARAVLAEARAIAANGGRKRLLAEADRLERELAGG
jgi:DNA-binding SARP family transcriptional activator/predicted ATPase